MCLEVVLGLKVNFFKSEIAGIFVVGQMLQDLVIIMGSKVISLTTSCLRLPLCVGGVLLTAWNPVMERVEQRLAP